MKRLVELKKNRYYLFTAETHEEVRLDFTGRTIDLFIKYWNQGYSSELIGKKLRLKQVEIALIVMDLEYDGKISPRPGGIFGTVNKEVS